MAEWNSDASSLLKRLVEEGLDLSDVVEICKKYLGATRAEVLEQAERMGLKLDLGAKPTTPPTTETPRVESLEEDRDRTSGLRVKMPWGEVGEDPEVYREVVAIRKKVDAIAESILSIEKTASIAGRAEREEDDGNLIEGVVKAFAGRMLFTIKAVLIAMGVGSAARSASVSSIEQRSRDTAEEVAKNPGEFRDATILDVLRGNTTVGGYLYGAKMRRRKKEPGASHPQHLSAPLSGEIKEQGGEDLRQLSFEADEILFRASEFEGIGSLQDVRGSGAPHGVAGVFSGYFWPLDDQALPAGADYTPVQEPNLSGDYSAIPLEGARESQAHASSPSSASYPSASSPTGGTSSPGSMPPPSGNGVLGERGAHGYARGETSVKPWLVEAVRFAAGKALPEGYRAEVISTVDSRDTGTPWHPSGRAIDIQIYDQSGRKVPFVGGPSVPGWELYERVGLAARQYQEKFYPAEKFVWGGHFNSGTPFDRMHFQSGGTSARNFSREQLESVVVPEEQMRSFKDSYGKPAAPPSAPPSMTTMSKATPVPITLPEKGKPEKREPSPTPPPPRRSSREILDSVIGKVPENLRRQASSVLGSLSQEEMDSLTSGRTSVDSVIRSRAPLGLSGAVTSAVDSSYPGGMSGLRRDVLGGEIAERGPPPEPEPRERTRTVIIDRNSRGSTRTVEKKTPEPLVTSTPDEMTGAAGMGSD